MTSGAPTTRPADWPRALPDRRSPCRIDADKGPHRHRCSTSHAELVEGYRSAAAAQEARAEAAAIGYATELADYYRDVEPRLTFRDWLQGSRDETRHHYEESHAA